MTARTDDRARGLPFIWLGPDDFTLPWRARFPAYLIGMMLAVGLFVFFWPFLPGWVLRVTVGPVLALTLAVYLTRIIGSFMDPNRTLRWHWQTLRAEVAGPRPSPTQVRVVTFDPDVFGDAR